MAFPLIPIAAGLEVLQLGKEAVDTAVGIKEGVTALFDDLDLKD